MQKQIIRVLSSIFPAYFTNLAYDKLTNPQIKKIRDQELVILNQSEKADLQFKDFTIKTYFWDNTGPEILLVHGWEGQAGNFADIIPRLLDKGYKVRAFDAPSHGFSSGGRTSLFDFTELVGVMIKTHKCRLLISHSFGGVATTSALYENQDLTVDKYILLTTPDTFSERINDVAQKAGIADKVKERLITRIETEREMSISTLNVSTFVQHINVQSALIIHDKNDSVIPISQSINVHKNWPQSEMKIIESTGHFRILKTDHVINTITDFLAN